MRTFLPFTAIAIDRVGGERSDGGAARRSQKPATPDTRSNVAVGCDAQTATEADMALLIKANLHGDPKQEFTTPD